jgi:hypothetical protein
MVTVLINQEEAELGQVLYLIALLQKIILEQRRNARRKHRYARSNPTRGDTHHLAILPESQFSSPFEACVTSSLSGLLV